MTPGLGKSNGRQESIPLTPGARSRFDTKKSSNGRLERVEFRRRISAILDVVGAFLRGVGSKKLADGGKDRVVGAGGGFSAPMLELGEDLLDRVQVRRIFRQEEKLRSGLSDGAAHSLAAMTAEIVHDNDFAGIERRNQALPDPGEKDRAVDRAVEETRRCDAIVAQRRYEGHGFPALEGRLADHSAAARSPASKRRHVGLGPGFINENQALGIDAVLIGAPLLAPALNVFAILFLGGCGFFMAQPLRVQELPDRAAVHLQPANAFKLVDELADGEVLLLAARCEPRRVLPAKRPWLVAPDLGWRGASCFAIPGNPLDSGTDRNSKPRGRLMARHSLRLDRRDNALTQVHRIWLCHPSWPPPSRDLESETH